MAAKNNKHTEPNEQAAEQAGVFWNPESESEAYKKRFSDQISRMQQRQLELVQQTADELESLKQELENGKELEHKIEAARQPLLTEITALRTSMRTLEEEKAFLEGQVHGIEERYRTQFNQLQGTISSLKNTLRSQAHTLDQQIRVFSLDVTQSLESMLDSLDHTQIPPFEQTPLPAAKKPAAEPALAHTIALTPSFDLQQEKFRLHEENLRKNQERVAVHPASRKTSPLRRFVQRTIVSALVLGAGFGGWHVFAQHSTPKTDQGAVAGVSTDPTITTTTTEYPEAHAIVSFADTTWDQINDTNIGISLQYPKNATDRVNDITTPALTLLRGDGYVLKIARDDSTSNIDTWMQNNQGQYADDYTSVKTTYKGQPAWVLTTNSTSTLVPGTFTVVKHGTSVLVIWAKTIDPSTDDGQRQAKILSTLQILPVTQ